MYGETGGLLRTELATLLRQHRIQPRLGGQGQHTSPETTTVEQRQALGAQIRRYRHALLIWTRQAVRVATPLIFLDARTLDDHGPAEDLYDRLDTTIQASVDGLPTLVELTTQQEFPMVESWRHVARAAALGEHDFDAGLGYGGLDDAQRMTLLKDASDIVRGLVVLDHRYKNIPGWEPLRHLIRLHQAAATCTLFAGSGEPDYTIDNHGWRPPMTAAGAPETGLAGVLQAEHNLLIELTRLPNAYSLRLVLDSQRALSHYASLYAKGVAPSLAGRWQIRAATYTRLVRETRDLGGPIGYGGLAAAHGAAAVRRIRHLAEEVRVEGALLRQLDQTFARVDSRMSDIIEHGASQRLYFRRVKVPRVVDQSAGLIKPVRARYVPIRSTEQTELLAIVRMQLRPPRPRRPAAPMAAVTSREDLTAAIVHRPGAHGLRLTD